MRAADNPFRSEAVLRVRYKLPEIAWEKLLHRLAEMHYRAAVVGPYGTGKTTLLEDLETRLKAKGFQTAWIRLRQDSPHWETGSALKSITRRILLVDGAEQLGWARWQYFKWLTRQAAGLIITTHRPGRLRTLWRCETSSRLLSDIIAELLTGSGFSPPTEPAELFSKHRGNLREALRECYDIVGRIHLESPAPPRASGFDTDTARVHAKFVS